MCEALTKHTRCRWCNMNNPIYVAYHDSEWGIAQYDDQTLFELLVLETFQAGLSWETILNKRHNFRSAFDRFDPNLVQHYDNKKVQSLMENPGIIRNRRKIDAAISNARVFLEIQKEWSSFSNYIWHFTDGRTIFETGKTHSELSDAVSKDLKQHGMKFVGTTVIYSYLQAIGVLYSHEPSCYLCRT